MEQRRRLPPGQYETKKWPVLHYGPIPRFDPKTWTFRVFGAVEEEKVWTYDQFLALPQRTVRCDIHCVTAWSKFDNDFTGVPFLEVMKHVRPKPDAEYVMMYAEHGYAANIPLRDLVDDDVLFAYKHNGENLAPEHGWPLRLVLPRLYFWKSAKWVRGMEFLHQDRPGFWEQRGYHIRGDPWKEERYSDGW